MILVTGATGKVGSNLVRELVARGVRPRAFVRDAHRAQEVLGEHVELAEGDLERPKTIDAALEGTDRLFLLAASSPLLPEHERNALDAAKRAGVRVEASSATSSSGDRYAARLAVLVEEAPFPGLPP